MEKYIDNYRLIDLEATVTVNHLVTVHYYEYSKNYIFEGERHNFWEFLYVDKGTINIMADDRNYTLHKGDMIFHKPGEWHTVVANGQVAPNLIVVAFDASGEAMAHFHQRVLSVDDRAKGHLAAILKESRHVFASDLNDPTLKALEKKHRQKEGAQQLIRLHLEMMLLEMIQDQDHYKAVTKTASVIREYAAEEKLAIIKNYLEEQVRSKLSLEDVCRATLLSKSSIGRIFKEGMNMGVMEYFRDLKIREAKTLIREGNHNFTQIAELLGYNSIHYFSRTFKKVTAMTLSEYAGSVMAQIDDASKETRLK